MRKNQRKNEEKKIHLDWRKGQIIFTFNPQKISSHEEMIQLTALLNNKPSYLMVKKGLIEKIQYIPYPAKDIFSAKEINSLLTHLCTRIQDQDTQTIILEEFQKVFYHIVNQEDSKT